MTTMMVRDLKVKQWIYHTDMFKDRHAWKISSKQKQHVREWDTLLTLSRENLEIKEFRKLNNTWWPGRSTVTCFLHVSSLEEFEICETVDERQFDWIMTEDRRDVMIATDLEPGLELDKLIAEKVLGWHQDDSKAVTPRSWWFDENNKGPLYLNCFSTDITAAWDLVEQFRLCVAPMIEEQSENRWTVFNLDSAIDQFLKDRQQNAALTAPHAICLAVLNGYEK